MEEDHKSKLVAELRKLLLENEISAEVRVGLLETILNSHLDSLEEIEDVDLFQDKLNDVIDDYVDQHFEDSKEEGFN